jgi:hypothetical protein
LMRGTTAAPTLISPGIDTVGRRAIKCRHLCIPFAGVFQRTQISINA